MGNNNNLIEKLKIKLTALSVGKSLQDLDIDVYDSCGGNYDDAYFRGQNDGEIFLARKLLKEFFESHKTGQELRPSIFFRPKIYMDGNKWCALYGDNIQDGVAGFGDSPELACLDFDNNWNKKIDF